MNTFTIEALQSILAKFPRVQLSHTPTPLEKLARMSNEFAPCSLYVKRDDCTGLAMGGNKSRQLEFYLGAALAEGCDCVLSTGAVQSNYMRMLAAAAAKLDLECHIQLEDRVAIPSDEYQHSGNVLLDQLLGAQVHYHPVGEDEDGADNALEVLAQKLSDDGKKPYIIPLGMGHAPTGALGYVDAAIELVEQIAHADLAIDLIAVGSGSGMTHGGLLTGLRLLDVKIPVLGVCMRRDAKLQHERVLERCEKLAVMLGTHAVKPDDIWIDDSTLAPGYGKASAQVTQDMRFLASREGLLTDPVYSGKTFSCVFNLLREGSKFQRIVVIHTGGTPALFGYREEVLS